mmetsp:Transcript_148303/g.413061  ORF Transcript_148303/g.413061 Transcript_148303/m.413061 type:complete len:355 (-) Transcript_148303:174-1238(-)
MEKDPPPSPAGSVASIVAEAGTPRGPASPGRTPCAARPPLPRAAPGSGSRAGSAGAAPGKRSEERRPRAPSEPPSRSAQSDPGEAASPSGALAGGPRVKARAASSSAPRPRLGGTPPPVERKDVGKVPAYLRRRQEEMAEEKRRAARPPSPQAPPGFRKVGEEERRGTLEVLKERKAEVEKAQRNLPFRIETVGQKQREKDLNDRIVQTNKLLDMFGKPLVFVPADAEPIAVAAATPPPAAGRSPSPRGARFAAIAADDGRNSAASGAAAAAPRGRSGGSGAMQHSGSAEALGRRQASRERRAAASAERRTQAGAAMPWDQLLDGFGGAAAPSAVRTDVRVAAPPGGRSTLQLG